eukprot:CAMPEP_0113454318 /NCGR_PEP_ID=MMETSP0014_2-20120614/7801_1 /TAXON_ID=2857 /ORGANISM="Nitzschia sp." /LENGTH=452 /DNA_ID=CAMNT_0000345719 /DNA_START=137 /DNA_END=1495 /DNA_ORIENTATION=+ /assembly_acc=CAM_ASM_000159
MVNYEKVNKRDSKRRQRSSSNRESDSSIVVMKSSTTRPNTTKDQDLLLHKVDSLQILKKAMMLTSPTPSGGRVMDRKSLQDSIDLASSRMNRKQPKGDAIAIISQGLKILDLDVLDAELLSESSSTLRTETTTSSSSESFSINNNNNNINNSSSSSSNSNNTKKEKTTTKKQRKRTNNTDMSTAATKIFSSSSSSKDKKRSKSKSSKSSKRSSDDLSSNSNERKRKKDKARFHTRFRLSMNEYIPPSSAPLTEEEIYDAWYTKEEFARMSSKCDKYVDEFGEKHSDSIQDMIRLVALCYQPTSRQQQQQQQQHQTSHMDGVDINKKNKNDKNKKLLEEQESDVEAEIMYTCCLSAAASVSIPSRARGLEYDIIRPLSESRWRHVRTIVEMFGDSRPSTRDLLMSTSGEDLDEVVAARSILLSRPHRMFARALAEIDAMARGGGIAESHTCLN